MNGNQIICGEAAQTLATFSAECTDLVVTDPPYLVRYRDRNGRTVTNDDNAQAVLSVYPEIYRVLKPDSYCISFYGWTEIAAFSEAWKNAGFRTIGHIVWTKPYASRSGHTRYCHESAFVLAKGYPRKPERPINDIQRWEYTGNRAHPTEKAVSVIKPLIENFSKPGDLVLDPFAGSGTTAVTSLLHGRDYIGIELEQRYCEIARKRLSGVARAYGLPLAA